MGNLPGERAAQITSLWEEGRYKEALALICQGKQSRAALQLEAFFTAVYGSKLFDAGKYYESSEYLNRAYESLPHVDDPTIRLVVVNQYTRLQLEHGNYRKACRELKETHDDLVGSCHHQQGLFKKQWGYLYWNWGWAEYKLGHCAEGLELLRKALAVFESIDSNLGQYVYIDQAKALLRMGDISEAIKGLNLVVLDGSDHVLLARWHRCHAEVLMEKGNFVEAKKAATEGYISATKTGREIEVVRSADQLKRIENRLQSGSVQLGQMELSRFYAKVPDGESWLQT